MGRQSDGDRVLCHYFPKGRRREWVWRPREEVEEEGKSEDRFEGLEERMGSGGGSRLGSHSLMIVTGG